MPVLVFVICLLYFTMPPCILRCYWLNGFFMLIAPCFSDSMLNFLKDVYKSLLRHSGSVFHFKCNFQFSNIVAWIGTVKIVMLYTILRIMSGYLSFKLSWTKQRKDGGSRYYMSCWKCLQHIRAHHSRDLLIATLVDDFHAVDKWVDESGFSL